MKKEGRLTARQVQFMQPEPGRRLEVPAGPPMGLYSVIHPTGKKAWAFRYRWKGRPKKLTFKDSYPDLTLAQARAEAQAAVEDLKNGIDPAVEKVAEKAEPDSVQAVVEEFIERYAKRNRSWRETERILRREAVSTWGKRPIQEVTRADVLRVLDAITDRGAAVMANRTHAALGKLFNWSIERGILEASPMSGVRPPAAEQSRDRVLSDDELGEMWKAAESLGYPFGPFYQVLLLTAQRRGEVASMRWSDVDLQAALWTLSAAQTKAGRIHDVPLSGSVLKLLDNLPRFDNGDFVFTTTGGAKPINGFSKAASRLDAAVLGARAERAREQGKDPAAVEGMANWKIHDLRRSAATHMAKANVPPHVLAAILNHSPGRTMGISAIYIRHKYLEERREALEAWGQHVLSLVGEQKSQFARVK